MSEEFKCRALTSEDWKDIKDEDLIDEEGLRLKENKRDGSYTSKPLDSGIPDCRWHRIVLEDAEIPENSTIEVSFYSSDEEEKEGAAKNWSGTIVFKNAKDALVEAPPGRYISLKIDFHREGRESPVLRQVKIYYPRLSYLRYLPAVYQEDSASKEFLERFLSIFESELHDSEETISRIPMYFDPKASPKEFVAWLASWLSLDLYELLGDKNREFILRAVDFYKQKGMVSGIASIVSFLTGQSCCIKEYMNNVFRSYGMEHEEEGEEIVDERGCTKFYRKTSKTVDTGYLFNWNNVPGNDSKRLLRFLRDDLNIVWAENDDICKSDDGKIRIVKAEKSVEIELVEDKKKATLKIRDGRTHDLTVKEENGKLDIYDTEILDLLATIDTYNDELHYVIDTSEGGRYSPHVIGLFIFVSLKEREFRVNRDELYKIINSFLPVFARPKIYIVEVPYDEKYDISRIIEEYEVSVHIGEQFKDVQGVYEDSVNWNWLYTHKDAWYLFNWDNVPGNDSERLLRYLMTAHDIIWAENAEICKSDDGKTIYISEYENSAEIVIDEDKEKATLKIRDGRTYDLKVKRENGKLSIYDAYKERTNNIYYRTPHSKIGVELPL